MGVVVVVVVVVAVSVAQFFSDGIALHYVLWMRSCLECFDAVGSRACSL